MGQRASTEKLCAGSFSVLLNLLRKQVKDERAVQMVKRYLKSGVMEKRCCNRDRGRLPAVREAILTIPTISNCVSE